MATLDPKQNKIDRLQTKISKMAEVHLNHLECSAEILKMLQCAASAAGWKVPDGPWNYNPLIAYEIQAKVEALFDPEKVVSTKK